VNLKLSSRTEGKKNKAYRHTQVQATTGKNSLTYL